MMKSNTQSIRVGGAAVLLAFALSGCAAAATASDNAEAPNGRTPSDYLENPPEPSEALEALLKKGVSESTYHEAFANYEKCMAEAGYELFAIDDKGPVIQYSIPDAAVQAGVHQVCYPEEFGPIDSAWQLANE